MDSFLRAETIPPFHEPNTSLSMFPLKDQLVVRNNNY